MKNRKAPAQAPARKDSKAARVRSARELFDIGLPPAMGVKLVSISPDRIVADLAVIPLVLNRTGRVGGGALMAMADVMGAAGSVMARPLGTRGGTIESKTNFFAPATGPVVRGECVALHVGRTTSVWQTTFTNRGGKKRRDAGQGKGDGIVAIVIQTQIGLPRSTGTSD